MLNLIKIGRWASIVCSKILMKIVNYFTDFCRCFSNFCLMENLTSVCHSVQRRSRVEHWWRRHCGIQTVSFTNALLSSHVRQIGKLTGPSRVSKHDKESQKFESGLPMYPSPLSGAAQYNRLAFEWPLNPIQFTCLL